MALETLNFWKTNIFICLFITLSFSTFVGCKPSVSTLELESVFIKKEISELQNIRSYFIEDIMELNDESFPLKFRNKMQKMEASGFASIKPKKLDHFFKTISKSTYNEIWETKTKKRRSTNGTYQYLAPKENGRYLEFLKKNTDHNPNIKQYYLDIEEAHKFSHLSILKYMSYAPLDFDLHNTNIQIVLAIHYLSILHDNNITSN